MNDLFSERYGYVAKELQYESINKIVKNHLWDEVDVHFLLRAKRMYDRTPADHERDEFDQYEEDTRDHAFSFYYSMNRDFLGNSVDEFPTHPPNMNTTFKNIIFNSTWYHCFDLIEAIIRTCPNLFPKKKECKWRIKQFSFDLNKVFEEERCAYRIAEGLIIPNVNNAEILTITDALVGTASLNTINIHLDQAIKHYSNRKNPDYRNSIKESSLALEALIKLIAGNKNGTMADALKLIKKRDGIGLHPALQNSLNSLYGWTGDESGIRHSLKDDSALDSDDAKLIIVTCCSFVSYLISKAVKSGIELTKN